MPTITHENQEAKCVFENMSMKRKAASGLLARRVRPRREDDWEPEADPASGGSSASEDDDEVSEEDIQRGNGQPDEDASEEEGSDEEVLSAFQLLHLFRRQLLTSVLSSLTTTTTSLAKSTSLQYPSAPSHAHKHPFPPPIANPRMPRPPQTL